MKREPVEITCEQLSLKRGGRRVLDELRCVFHPGELTAIVGPNGAGKSTLLEILAGILSPTSGALRFDGRDTQRIPAAERARLCAYLPQAETPAWSLAAADMVALGLLPWGRRDGDSERIDTALQLVDAGVLAQRPVTELSGGELRRVQLARLLVGEAPLLIADEPSAALDIRHQLQLMHNFRRVADAGKTVILALHDLALAARFCDRVLLLQDGRLRAQGAPEDVFTPALIGDVYGISCEFRWRNGVADFVPLDLI
ncbi:ABC transporter ATP-binding protein [Microbulbifer sp. SAOS-129_SWC]|uniref:ABC transporter ATP-binding protein n=1 Tax=Microbulbifer sp. SAOS-129_SWC TaxID=3145235 RepID=UPI00321781D2